MLQTQGVDDYLKDDVDRRRESNEDAKSEGAIYVSGMTKLDAAAEMVEKREGVDKFDFDEFRRERFLSPRNQRLHKRHRPGQHVLTVSGMNSTLSATRRASAYALLDALTDVELPTIDSEVDVPLPAGADGTLFDVFLTAGEFFQYAG